MPDTVGTCTGTPVRTEITPVHLEPPLPLRSRAIHCRRYGRALRKRSRCTANPVRMMHRPELRLAARDRHRQCVPDRLGRHMSPHRPAHDPTAPDTHRDREVEPTGRGGHVRDVSDPEPVRPIGREIPVDEVRSGLRPASSGAPPALPSPATPHGSAGSRRSSRSRARSARFRAGAPRPVAPSPKALHEPAPRPRVHRRQQPAYEAPQAR